MRLAAAHDLVVCVEDNLRTGGVGSALDLALRDAEIDVPLRAFGLPTRFFEHAKRPEVLAEAGLTAQVISRAVIETVARLQSRQGITETTAENPPVLPSNPQTHFTH